MKWRRFQEKSDAGLARRFGEHRVLHEPELPSGSRPDHVVLARRGSTVEAVLDSKDKALVTHADVTQLLRYDDELAPTKTLGFIVRETTTIPESVAARIDVAGIAVFVQSDEEGDEERDIGRAFGVGMAAAGAGGLAYTIAKNNGAQHPEAWGFAGALLGLFLTTR